MLVLPIVLAAAAAVPSVPNGTILGEALMADGGKTYILDVLGKCPEGWSTAVYVGPAGQVLGCWFEKGGDVWIKWDDGDRSGTGRDTFKAPKES